MSSLYHLIVIKIKKLKIKSAYGKGNEFLSNPKTLNAFYGTCFGHPYYSRANLRDIIINLSQYTNQLLLVRWDSIYVHDLVAFKGLTYDQAIKKVELCADEFKRSFLKISRSLKALDLKNVEFKLCFSSEIYKNEKFSYLKRILTDFYEHDGCFRDDVHQQIMQTPALGERISQAYEKNPATAEQILSIASRYGIEQTAAHFYFSYYTPYEVRISNDPLPRFMKNIFNDKYSTLKNELGLKNQELHYIEAVLENEQ